MHTLCTFSLHINVPTTLKKDREEGFVVKSAIMKKHSSAQLFDFR